MKLSDDVLAARGDNMTDQELRRRVEKYIKNKDDQLLAISIFKAKEEDTSIPLVERPAQWFPMPKDMFS